MSYYIDIIDTTSPLNRIVPELASGGGIELKWNGGDKKEELGIVPTEFNFDMLDPTHQDAAFVAFYTGNETKWKVHIVNAADDSIVWQGFILPDLYSEPYKNGNLFVNFTATDGLGRLKGKYLPDEYYSREKSVIDIFSQCLRLTGLELDLYFAPAIENFSVKNWNLIFVDTENFIDKDKKKDAYSILETLLQDKLCICYQADNRWYIEGYNMRHLRKVTYKNYDYLGNFVGTVIYNRLVKKIKPLDEPNVSIIPPYNEIIVSHEKTAPGLPETASVSKNDGWAVVTGVVGQLFPQDWMGNNGYYGRCLATDYNTTVYNQFFFDANPTPTWGQDDTKFISLVKKLYFAALEKVKISLSFDIVHPATGEKGNPETWNNVMKYQILFNGVVLFSNVSNGGGDIVEDRENLTFSTGGNCKIEIEHIFPVEGLLDIRLFRPVGKTSVNGVLGVKLAAAKIEIIDFKEEVIETNLINDDFTVDVEKQLEFADDKTGSSKGFRLAKLKEDTSIFNEIDVFIYEGFVFDGKNYARVQLDHAQLIKKNPYTVTYDGNSVIVLDVIYNFLGGDRMVVQTLDLYTSGTFKVRKYAIADVVGSRAHWAQWTDAFYKIENNSYLKTVANIYRRLFNAAHERLDLTAKNAVKFNDIIQFNYVFLKEFQVLNCTWNLDTNKTELTLGRSNYKELDATNPNETNIPPIVEAGDPVYIEDGVDGISVLASAYDPDGEIVSQQWTKLEGDGGEVIANPNQLGTFISGLTGDAYVFQIQVTDNAGATAVDRLTVIRKKNYNITLDLIEEIMQRTGNPRFIRQKYKLNVSPALMPGASININGTFFLYARGATGRNDRKVPTTAFYNIERNGQFIEGKSITSKSAAEVDIVQENIPLLFNFLPGDNVIVTCYVGKNNNSSQDRTNRCLVISECKLQTAVLGSGFGNVTGLPVNKQLKIEKNW